MNEDKANANNISSHTPSPSLNSGPITGEKDRILQEKDAELKRMQDMLDKMHAQMQQQQQQQRHSDQK